ncbi:MAG: hypothetical protein EBQ96_05185 [Proteobacteria bacterium]|nr:hypothetical protein [Pseudomonadota bacterium]
MMTSLTVVLGASLMMFVTSLAYAIVKDWLDERSGLHKAVSEQLAQTGFKPKRTFDRAARRPVRILGSFIL